MSGNLYITVFEKDMAKISFFLAADCTYFGGLLQILVAEDSFLALKVLENKF